LRHASATAKLRATHDVKAVQGDTGHATADMLQNVYAGILDEDRKNTTIKMEEAVFSKLEYPVFLESEEPVSYARDGLRNTDEPIKNCRD